MREHLFTSEKQPTPEQRPRGPRQDPLTSCLKAYLLDSTKAAADSPDGLSARMAKYPPRITDIIRTLFRAATDSDDRNFAKAQGLIWERIAGKVRQDVAHQFPEVREGMTINTATITPPPMPSAN